MAAAETARPVVRAEGLEKRFCQHLSGGQQQRVAIARMLMQEPAVVIADEPVASLDPRAGREVMTLLWEVSRERGMTVLCSLHQLDLARELGGRILGMKAGRIAFDAPASRVDDAELGALYDGTARVDAEAPPAAVQSSAIA